MTLRYLLRGLVFLTVLMLASCRIAGVSESSVNQEDDNYISAKNISFLEVGKKIKANYDPSSRSSAKLIVNIALDGSENIAVWEETLDFAQENNVKFTFFIVGVHLLQDSLANLYNPPRRERGRSDVGFGGIKLGLKVD